MSAPERKKGETRRFVWFIVLMASCIGYGIIAGAMRPTGFSLWAGIPLGVFGFFVWCEVSRG